MQKFDPIEGDILIVDDTPENLRLLSKALMTEGYEVRAVLDGPTALSAVQTDPPDLILLDIRMPEMDGYEVCRLLKTNVTTMDIPVIFLSALDDSLDKVNAFKVGGVDYITKPFQTTEVLARVKNQLTISLLRQKLTAQNEELLRSNQELEQFAYVVSHDLKQPLRLIRGFASLIGRNYQQNLDDEGQTLLAQIKEAGIHMNELIDNLLTYCKVGSQGATLESTDCNTVITQVLADMQVAIEQYDASITYEPLPTVMADTIQLRELFQNLISNAMKFQREDEIPKVSISAKQCEQEWQFAVSDNGIGIAPNHLERIFQAFQRLHTKTEYPGSGIGLAICKKVIERHGGRIWVESTLNAGTTFNFTLPVSNAMTEKD